MKIQTKKSATKNLNTYIWRSNNLHKFYNFETGEQGDLLLDNLFIQRFKDKVLKDANEIYLAWELVELLKKCNIDLDSTYNFTLCFEDGRIKITVGGDCAIIKNNLPEYVTYLRFLGYEGIESYIKFELE